MNTKLDAIGGEGCRISFGDARCERRAEKGTGAHGTENERHALGG
jgi:hypothetical protein